MTVVISQIIEKKIEIANSAHFGPGKLVKPMKCMKKKETSYQEGY